jgi:glycosyltransferase involved in cell wall biosynthesis
VGGLAFLVQDGVTGYVVPDGDAEALCQRLLTLYRDRPLRDRLGEQAAAAARSYDWEIIAKQIIRLYDETLAAPVLESSGQHLETS